MPTYFKPLRRKIGVVTLVLACVFSAGWVRSLIVQDCVDFHELFSSTSRDQVTYGLMTRANSFAFVMIVDTATHVGTEDIVSIPFVCIVIPLTLLSAWLLFSKPRPKPKPTE